MGPCFRRDDSAVDGASGLRQVCTMTTTKLDLTGLKCPLPALKTRKALKTLKPGDRLEVHCTDPLAVIDIPNLIGETGDKVEITARNEQQIVFLIEKTDGLSPAVAVSGIRDQDG
jgi:tRNA 2-thiouridine synthesizing protein A